MAKKNKFPNWDKHGSAGVCFIGNVPLRDYLKKHISLKQGNVLDVNKNIIGTHQGARFYTIGQRVGSHIGVILQKANPQKKWYVASKKGNTLTVAQEGNPALLRKSVTVKNFYKFTDKLPKIGLKARIRHLGKLVPCKLSGNKVTFSNPQFGVAAGQSLVLYIGQQIVGGGEMSL
jgi:tRNA-specific 2-thiouridylase